MMKPTTIAAVLTAVVAIGIGYLVAGRPVAAPGAIVFSSTTTTSLASVVSEPSPASDSGTTTTTLASSDTTSTTLASGSSSSVPSGLDERSAVRVGVGNANGVVGSAGSVAEALVRLGYVDVSAFDVGDTADVSTVFHADGFRDEAARLADDAGLDADATAPAALAPVDLDDGGFDLVVVLGLDRP